MFHYGLEIMDIQQDTHMEITRTKEQYTSPRCEELDVRTEGVLAATPGPYSGFGEEETL
jgi:hypothetical protein